MKGCPQRRLGPLGRRFITGKSGRFLSTVHCPDSNGQRYSPERRRGKVNNHRNEMAYRGDSVDALIKTYGARIGGPDHDPRRANTWPQVGMNGRPFLAWTSLINSAS
jgi:hypothetical protein